MTGESALPYSPRLSGLTANPGLPADLLSRFISVADVELCLDLARRDDLSPSQIRMLVARGGTEVVQCLVRRHLVTGGDVDPTDARVVLALLDEGGAPDPWARGLQAHPDASVRAALADAEQVPAAVLRALATDRDAQVVAAAAGSPRLAPEQLEQVATHPHLSVRRAVAGNRRTPAALLAALGTDGMLSPARLCSGCDGTAGLPPGRYHCDGGHESALMDLRYAVTANPATPPAVAAANVDHPAMWVRSALAQREDLPPEVYRRLANDPVPGVRAYLAENPAIGDGLIRVLAGDTTNDVRRRVAHNPSAPLDVLSRLAPATRIGATLLPRIATAGPAEVESLVRSPVAALRMWVAERPDLPPEAVDLLAEDPDAKVLKSLAPNRLLTEAQLRAMVTRHGPRVIARVAGNPNCSADQLYDLATHIPPVHKAYRTIAAHPNANAATLLLCLRDHRARPIAAAHPALPARTVVELLHDHEERVAEAAASNPALPIPEMQRLLAR